MLGDQKACPDGITAAAPASGYMSDYGEYVPFDGIFASGESAQQVHNKYPSLWSQTCREAQKEAGRDGDVVFWSRSSGLPTVGGYSTAFWAGDQTTSWDDNDGLASALLGMLSAGISGMAITHSDIGGFTMVSTPVFKLRRSEELLLRWAEMAAFSDSLFRTHPGLLPDKAAQIVSNNNTLQYFKLFAKIHSLMWPYRKMLMEEAQSTGAPIARHMFLQCPNDENCWNLPRQYFLGQYFLVAPVLTGGSQHVTMYFPNGTWTLLWEDGYDVIGSTYKTVPAPLGKPAVYVSKAGLSSPTVSRIISQMRDL